MALVTWDTPAHAQAPRKAGTVRHVELAGDLDSMRIVGRLDEEITSAARAGAGLILLELDGDRWRSDVVWSAAQKVRESPIPFAVYLSDTADRTIGAGQLALGLLAADCFVEPGTTVREAPGNDLRDLVPEETDIEQVTRELSGALYTRLTELSAPADLADVLVHLGAGMPQPLLWVLYEPASQSPARLVREDPVEIVPGTRNIQIVGRAFDGTARLNIPAEVGVRMHVYRSSQASPGAMGAALGFRGGIKSRVRLSSGLSEARRQAGDDFEDLDTLFERVKTLLDLPDPPDAAVSPDRYRRAGRSALEEVETGRSFLARAEKSLADYPELLRAPAPGQTSVGGTPSVFASRWRSAVQSRRDRLDKLEARARLFAGR